MTDNNDNIITFEAPKPSSYDIHIGWCVNPKDDDDTIWYIFDNEQERDRFLFAFSEASEENVDYMVFDKPHYYRDGAWREGTALEADGPDKARERFAAMSRDEFSQYIFRHLPRQAQIKMEDYIQQEVAFVITEEEWNEFREKRKAKEDNVVRFPNEQE